VDDVSVEDQVKAIKSEDGISKRLVVVTNSGPVLLQLLEKLMVDDATKFQLLGVIFEPAKERFKLHIDLLQRLGTSLIPQISINLGAHEVSERGITFVGTSLLSLKKIPKIRLDL